MTEPVLLCATDARGVATVTFNRPQVNNAYNADVILGLIEIFGGLATDEAVRLVVLRGNGRHFQAGADLTWLQAVATCSQADNVVASRATAAAPSAGSLASTRGPSGCARVSNQATYGSRDGGSVSGS